jgi:hypothetical protein
MTEDRKPTADKPVDRNEALIRRPYVYGKLSGAVLMGKALVKTGKGYRQTEPLSEKYLEYLAAAVRLVHFLSGFYDAIEEVFGEGEHAKGMFERVIEAKTNSKAGRKFREQVTLVRQYLVEPNASKVAREAARGDDGLAASKLQNLKRWRKKGRIVHTAMVDSLLGIDTILSDGSCPPTLKEILQRLSYVEKLFD